MTNLRDKKLRLVAIAEEIKKTNENYRLLFQWHRSSLGLMGLSGAVLMQEAAEIIEELHAEMELLEYVAC